MGRGEQGEPVGKSGIISDQRTGGVVGHFPSRSVVEMPAISTCNIFCILFGWHLPVHCSH